MNLSPRRVPVFHKAWFVACHRSEAGDAREIMDCGRVHKLSRCHPRFGCSALLAASGAGQPGLVQISADAATPEASLDWRNVAFPRLLPPHPQPPTRGPTPPSSKDAGVRCGLRGDNEPKTGPRFRSKVWDSTLGTSRLRTSSLRRSRTGTFKSWERSDRNGRDGDNPQPSRRPGVEHGANDQRSSRRARAAPRKRLRPRCPVPRDERSTRPLVGELLRQELTNGARR